MTIVITWNGVDSDDVVPEVVFTNPVRGLLGEFRGSMMPVPGRYGSWAFPEVRGRRDITVSGFVLADSFPTARRDAVTKLADWLDVPQEAELIISDEPTVFYLAVLGDTGDINEWREVGEFEIVWHCQPYSFDTTITEIDFVGADFALTELLWDPGLTGPAVYPVVEVEPSGGNITEFALNINGRTLYYTGLINSGDILTINSVSATVTQGPHIDSSLTGGYNAGDLDMAGVGGVFPTLIAGDNPIFWTADGTATGVDLRFFFRKTYRK